MTHEDRYSFLGRPVGAAEVVIQDVSSGPWIFDPVASASVPRPARYWLVREGIMAAVLGGPGSGTLFRRDLLASLQRLGVPGLHGFEAVIERLKDRTIWSEYSVVKVGVSVSLADWFATRRLTAENVTSRPPLVRIEGVQEVYAVENETRVALEQHGIPDLEFGLPILCA